MLRSRRDDEKESDSLFIFVLLNFAWRWNHTQWDDKKTTGFLVLSNKFTMKVFYIICVHKERRKEGDTNISFRYVICIYSNQSYMMNMDGIN